MQKTKALPANPEHKHEVKTAVNPTVGFWAGPLVFVADVLTCWS